MTLNEFLDDWHSASPTLMVHTSGSTGKPKPMFVEKARMAASARMTCSFLGLDAGDVALLCMPLDYIAGKMMVVRAEVCGMKLVDVPPSGHPLANDKLCHGVTFAAMVPLQVYNSLQVPEETERLMAIRHLIIGGGAIDSKMETALSAFPNNVWSTYGMTETLSHIAMRRINGPDASAYYTPLPGVEVDSNEDGCLIIDAPAVCASKIITNDIVEFGGNGQSQFKVLGRKDNVICCGGIKIQAEQVEELLAPYVNAPFFITKAPHPKYGEIPVLVTESKDKKILEDIFKNVLPKYWIPKRIVTVNKLPLTETGKPQRRIVF